MIDYLLAGWVVFLVILLAVLAGAAIRRARR